jgi:glycosyltransferase involved in cell wall biosynthesis/O-antigen/teichoic acid export membrane protein
MGQVEGGRPLHILVLADRDWTHPDTGGNGANLYAQISRWVAWGHRVTMVTGQYPGGRKVERFGPRLVVHRAGGRATVFPHAFLAVMRGIGRDADVVLEVINGIAFLTPLWLRKPRVAMVHHVHRELFLGEFGRAGQLLFWVAERLPLRYFYQRTPFLTISRSARDDLVREGVPHENITVEYLGVDPDKFRRGKRAGEPRLIFVGRLKAYKRVETLFDVLEAVPGMALDVVGEGDHRPDLEAEIERRGLGARVRMHGYVDEQTRAKLYGQAWVNVTASQSEGWSLTVMEAALCRTPSAALAVGGLPESIVDGETGLLARDTNELVDRVRELAEQPDLRERLGEAAERRARTFSWDRSARAYLDVIESEASGGSTGNGPARAGSLTTGAAALAAITLAGHAIGAVFAFTFARLLGATDYGSLAALLSAFIIVAVPGSALQVAAAREVKLGRLRPGSATLRRWSRHLMFACLALAAVGAVMRRPLAELIGVSEVWAAAALPPTLALWLLVSLQRGVLQGVGAYRAVGRSIVADGLARLAIAVVLVVLGAGVTGAVVATPLSLIVVTPVLALVLDRLFTYEEPLAARARRLRDLVGIAWVPVVGLTLLAALQNLDVIMVRHEIGGGAAGSYAAAALAAKTLVWVAIGMGLYLLPEAARLARAGGDPRVALRRALAAVGALFIPLLAIFLLVPGPLLRLAFGSDLAGAADQLPILALAMALLGIASLAVQYMLVLERVAFFPVLAAIALVQPVVLGAANDLSTFATLVLGLQSVAAVSLLAFALGTPRREVRVPS